MKSLLYHLLVIAFVGSISISIPRIYNVFIVEEYYNITIEENLKYGINMDNINIGPLNTQKEK